MQVGSTSSSSSSSSNASRDASGAQHCMGSVQFSVFVQLPYNLQLPSCCYADVRHSVFAAACKKLLLV
jgi:hypothetical protein